MKKETMFVPGDSSNGGIILALTLVGIPQGI